MPDSGCHNSIGPCRREELGMGWGEPGGTDATRKGGSSGVLQMGGE